MCYYTDLQTHCKTYEIYIIECKKQSLTTIFSFHKFLIARYVEMKCNWCGDVADWWKKNVEEPMKRVFKNEKYDCFKKPDVKTEPMKKFPGKNQLAQSYAKD